MEQKEVISILLAKRGSIILGSLLIVAMSFLFLVVHEKNYKTQTDFLIVQNNRSGQQDFYTLSRSAEYSGRVLSEAIRSELFLDEVMKSGKVDGNILPTKKVDKIRTWNKTVKVNSNSELGMISVVVLHDDKDTSVSISEGIKEVLTAKNYLFRGHGQDIDIRVLTGPVFEKNPTIAHIIMTVVGGFAFGCILMSMTILYRAMYRKHTSRIIDAGPLEN